MRALLLLALVGCVSSNAQVCDDGSICPRGFTCDVDNQRCLAPGAEAACAGLEDGAACDLDGVDGTCRLGACEPNVCGDGVRQGTEACDGDQIAIDSQTGIPYDCRSFGAYTSEGLTCYPKGDPRACTLNTDFCFNSAPRCGDDVVNGPEVCDGNTSTTCLGLGFDAGSVICGEHCNFSILNCSRFGFNVESLGDIVGLAVTGTSHSDQWVVGLGGKIAHYDGVFWNPVPANERPSPNTLRAVHAISDRDVWAIGEASTVIHYVGTDVPGTGTWSLVTGVPLGDYVDLWAASATEVYVATSDIGILKFDGASWTTLPTVPGTPFSMRGTNDPADTMDATQLWVATTEGPLQHFDDATQLWTITQSPPNMVTKFTDPNSPTDVWAIGHKVGDQGNGMIGHFDGAGWTTVERPGEIFNNVASSGPNDAWIAGVDGLMRHFDGAGFSNSLNISLGSGVTGLSGFLSLGADEVVAVSTLRISFRYRGQTFGQFKTLGGDPFTGPTNLSFFTLAPDDAWITNANRDALHFDGTQWKVETSFTTPAHAMFAFPPVAPLFKPDVWFGLDDGRAVHFDGTNFVPENVTNTRITQMFGSGTADLWAFSIGGAFHRNAQSDWTFFPFATAADPFTLSVSGTAPDNIWAVSQDTAVKNRIFHWDGSKWSEVPHDSPEPILAIAAVSPTDVHASARNGFMLHFTGGSSFTTIQQVGTIDEMFLVNTMVATSFDDVIAASAVDAFHFDGVVWSPLRLPDEIRNPGAPKVHALRATPGRVDFLLDRFKIMTLIRTRALVCRNNEADSCSDGVDNDCDGKIDSVDANCP
jgi:hypothetical protein